MEIERENVTRVCSDTDVYAGLLDLTQANIVELGCGAAQHARAIAARYPACRVTAYEVDRIQLEHNRSVEQPHNIAFRYGGAEAIDCADASVDVVLMFKSLHHVPADLLEQALKEIARILRPGGHAYFSEPVFAGAFNDIIRLFHDEQRVREAAFAALQGAVNSGLFELVDEVFFLAPTTFNSFADFEQRIIAATHTEHHLDVQTRCEVEQRFARHLGADGALFHAPMRVDLLRKTT